MTRIYMNPARIQALARELSDRELAILSDLDRLRLASGSQLERLHFTTDTARNRRRVLQSLVERRLITRLDRLIGGRRSGSAGFVFALDIAGQRALQQVTQAPVRRPTTPGAPFVRHVLAITELYCQLIEAERRGGFRLLEFEAEPAAWRHYSGRGGAAVVKPDAYVRLVTGVYEDSWFIEVDRGTEAPSTLARKCDVYRAYFNNGAEQRRRGVFPRVLWLVPGVRRYQVVVDICGRQPADTWQLHQVTLYTDAVGLMTGGAS